MFTGIVELAGVIEALELTGAATPAAATGARLRVRAPEVAPHLQISASIAVNGCCLTVIDKTSQYFIADLSGETLRRTAFREIKPAARVNLERPLTAGKELGGHFVQGHVDGVGRVTRLEPEGQSWWLGVRVPQELERYVAMKGSIAVDGISLTVAAWHDGVAEMAVIPYTYAQTNIRGMRSGDAVNIECDILAKYVERLLDARTPS
ncbi:MAG: riboflavin synthase [Acidipila sp.]|nr:riboflavin synthase [Acidipila sp.]